MSNNVKCRKKTTNKMREDEKVIPFAYLLYIEKIIKCFYKYIYSLYIFIHCIIKYLYLINITYKGVYNYG